MSRYGKYFCKDKPFSIFFIIDPDIQPFQRGDHYIINHEVLLLAVLHLVVFDFPDIRIYETAITPHRPQRLDGRTTSAGFKPRNDRMLLISAEIRRFSAVASV